jgi:signal recognition particle receptor subunit beta
MNSIYNQKDENFPKIIVCNKTDLRKKVTPTQIKNFSSKYKTSIFQASVKNSENIIPAFDCLIKIIIEEKIKNEKKERITLNLNSNYDYYNLCNC